MGQLDFYGICGCELYGLCSLTGCCGFLFENCCRSFDAGKEEAGPTHHPFKSLQGRNQVQLVYRVSLGALVNIHYAGWTMFLVINGITLARF